VLSIGKLATGQAKYYLDQAEARVDFVDSVAVGIEEYCVGSGEAQGEWLGISACELGLAGGVDGAALRRVLDGPTVVGMSAARRVRVSGFHLTFSAPRASASASLSVNARRRPSSPQVKGVDVARDAHTRALAVGDGVVQQGPPHRAPEDAMEYDKPLLDVAIRARDRSVPPLEQPRSRPRAADRRGRGRSNARVERLSASVDGLQPRSRSAHRSHSAAASATIAPVATTPGRSLRRACVRSSSSHACAVRFVSQPPPAVHARSKSARSGAGPGRPSGNRHLAYHCGPRRRATRKTWPEIGDSRDLLGYIGPNARHSPPPSARQPPQTSLQSRAERRRNRTCLLPG
jgi:hypothetical protein